MDNFNNRLTDLGSKLERKLDEPHIDDAKNISEDYTTQKYLLDKLIEENPNELISENKKKKNVKYFRSFK